MKSILNIYLQVAIKSLNLYSTIHAGGFRIDSSSRSLLGPNKMTAAEIFWLRF